MKKAFLCLAFCALIGCVSQETKRTMVFHDEACQAFVREMDANRTTREQERGMLRAHAKSMSSLTALAVGGGE